jgi:hypothetical protein
MESHVVCQWRIHPIILCVLVKDLPSSQVLCFIISPFDFCYFSLLSSNSPLLAARDENVIVSHRVFSQIF